MFFAFTVYYTNNPLSEFCHIHLNSTAYVRQLEGYWDFNCNQLHNNCSYSLRFSTVVWTEVYLRGSGKSRCCATGSHFLWPHS